MIRRVALAALLLGCVGLGVPAPASPAPAGIVIAGPSGGDHVWSAVDLAELPQTHVTASFGAATDSYDGPLLWDVLAHAGAIDPVAARTHVRQTVTATGRDGYMAVLALGEIDPAFEGKPVILALTMSGKPLGADHVRLIVPGDRRGGRSVRDVVRLQAD